MAKLIFTAEVELPIDYQPNWSRTETTSESELLVDSFIQFVCHEAGTLAMVVNQDDSDSDIKIFELMAEKLGVKLERR